MGKSHFFAKSAYFIRLLVGGGLVPPQDLSGDKSPTYPYYLTHTIQRRAEKNNPSVGIRYLSGLCFVKDLTGHQLAVRRGRLTVLFFLLTFDLLTNLKQMDKSALRKILQERDWPELFRWWDAERGAQRALLSVQFDNDEAIKRSALEALGRICGRIYPADSEWVKGLVRHFLWGMNDESGNLIWHAPEALAEILFNCPDLIEEYTPVVVSFAEDPAFTRGVLAFIQRLSALHPELFRQCDAMLVKA